MEMLQRIRGAEPRNEGKTQESSRGGAETQTSVQAAGSSPNLIQSDIVGFNI